MRLLSVNTGNFQQFEDDSRPPYAILSHTWRSEEVTFQDMNAGRASSKTGYEKVRGCCNQARVDGFSHVWIDTCCIDKQSSSELSEAINSMYRWYQSATCCYVLLDDYRDDHDPLDNVLCEHFRVDADTGELDLFCKYCFSQCRWQTRGWTLQELLAPSFLKFYDVSWVDVGYVGTTTLPRLMRTPVRDLGPDISESTNIPRQYIDNEVPVSSASIAQRFSWASKRKTTRTEDIAYCLLGLFDVNMPLLYGEGRRSFIRLQEEIMKIYDDQSIFAWGLERQRNTLCWVRPIDLEVPKSLLRGSREPGTQPVPLLAFSPAWFKNSSSIIPCPPSKGNRGEPHAMTNRGLRIDSHFLENDVESLTPFAVRLQELCYIALGCVEASDRYCFLTMAVLAMERNIYARVVHPFPIKAVITPARYTESPLRSIYLLQQAQPYMKRDAREVSSEARLLIVRKLPRQFGKAYSAYPAACWDEAKGIVTLDSNSRPAVIVFELVGLNAQGIALTVEAYPTLEWHVHLEKVTLPTSAVQHSHQTGAVLQAGEGKTFPFGTVSYSIRIEEDLVMGGVYGLSVRQVSR